MQYGVQIVTQVTTARRVPGGQSQSGGGSGDPGHGGGGGKYAKPAASNNFAAQCFILHLD
jgi:hypothetical protein